MMREAIAKRLSQSSVEAPHFFLTVEVNMEAAIAFRESLNAFDEENKISFNDIIVKACAVALQNHPGVNATFMGDRVRLFGDVHVGVAVAIDDGLITPVIRDVDKKGLRDISQESKDLAARPARETQTRRIQRQHIYGKQSGNVRRRRVYSDHKSSRSRDTCRREHR